MNKIISLIKVSLNHDMNIFKINTKKQSKYSKILIPFILTSYIMLIFGIYANKMMNILKPLNLEFVVITLFSLAICIITLMEGIYKSSNLLFNCKDDNLLFSLPIKKTTILLIRIFKFYLFELLYNSLFLLPAIIVYAVRLKPAWTYYLSSIMALIILPIIPVILSCIIGFIITSLSSKFKGKNIAQTIITIVFLVGVMYISYGLDGFINHIASKANNINEIITKLYYPVGAYITLITDFQITKLLIYIAIHIIISIIAIILLGKVYFKVNSSEKKVIENNTNKKYIIKTRKKWQAFVKKEINVFISTPVYITNTGFGLVLYIIGCIYISLKFNSLAAKLILSSPGLTLDKINNFLPVISFGLLVFTALMTSITSSMISLEGKAINILKSMPIKPFEIIIYKVISALVVMIPCILIGDIILFIRFKFNIISILLLLILSFILPLVSELIGIIINLKYPKLDATNPTEVVKQSMSSMLSVFIGMGLIAATLFILIKLLAQNLNTNLILLIFTGIYSLISIILLYILEKNSSKQFNSLDI